MDEEGCEREKRDVVSPLGHKQEETQTSNKDTKEVKLANPSTVEPMGVYGSRGECVSIDAPASTAAASNSSKVAHYLASRSFSDNSKLRKTSVVKQIKSKVRQKRFIYYSTMFAFLALHFVDVISDIYMIVFYRNNGFMMYFWITASFFAVSLFLATFWNYELYNGNISLALASTLLGPVSRNIFVEVVPKRKSRVEGWRDSDEEETEEVKNFTLIFAAMFEDFPQAFVNLAFLSKKGNDAPLGAIIQVCASLAMGFMKVQHGCHNILCNYYEDDMYLYDDPTVLSVTAKNAAA